MHPPDGDYANAMAAFKRVLRIDPRDCASMTKCGICHEEMGDDDQGARDRTSGIQGKVVCGCMWWR